MPVIKKAAEEKKQQQLTEMVKFAHDRLPPDVFATMQPFMANYYSQVGEEQVQSRNISDLYGAVMSHWQFARHFKTGAPRVRIYNPQIDEHGWESAHSVIEIVNDDMPFLVDSVTTEINRLGLTLHAAIHPVFRVWRDASGQVERIQAATDISAKIDEQHNAPKLESYIHFEIDRCTEPQKLEEILTGVKKVLSDVRAAVEDWHGMMTSATAAVTELNDQPGKDDTQQAEIDEGRAFLEWMINDHFTFSRLPRL